MKKIDASSVAQGINAATGKPEAAFFVLHPEPKIADKRVLLQGLASLEMYFLQYMQLQAKLQELQANEKSYQAAKHNAEQLAIAAEGPPQGQIKAAINGFESQIAEYEGQSESLADVTNQAVIVYEKVWEISEQIQRSRANLIADWNFADPYDPTKSLSKPLDDPTALDHLTERQQEFINQHIEIVLNGNQNRA